MAKRVNKRKSSKKNQINALTRNKTKRKTSTLDLSNDIASRIDADIAASASVLYGDEKLIYIHNRSRNFLAGAGYANTFLRSCYGDLLSAWQAEAKELLAICATNESNFFHKLQSNSAIEGIGTKQGFIRAFQDQWQKAKVDLSQMISFVAKLPSGKKTQSELNTIAEYVIKLNNAITGMSSNVIDQDFAGRLTTLANTATKFQKWCNDRSIDGSATSYKGKPFQYTDGLSVTNMLLHVLPSALESMIGKTCVELIGESLVKNTAKQTSTATGDLMIDGISISIKSNKTALKQEKQRQLKSFFNWVHSNNTEMNSLQQVGRELTQQRGDVSIQNALYYLFMNYSALSQINATNILQDAWKVVVLSSLNEKMFGYNKAGQGRMKDIVSKLPVAVINSQGQIIYMSDIVTQLIDAMKPDLSQVLKLASYKLMISRVSLKELGEAKTAAIQKWKKTHRNNMDNFTYRYLKQEVAAQLSTIVQTLSTNITLSVQYKIDFASIISEVE